MAAALEAPAAESIDAALTAHIMLPAAAEEIASAAVDAGSESDDSDYDPSKDPHAQEDDVVDTEKAQERLGPRLQGRRKRKVDALWDDMNASDQQYVRRVTGASVASVGSSRRRKSKGQRQQALKVLREIFGIQSAGAIVGAAAGARRKRNRLGSGHEDSEAVRQAARAAVQNVKHEKVQITQSVRFAGEMTTVTRTVDAHSKEAAQAAVPAPMKSGLETVLDEMKGPKVITTLEKTSVDWDGYKEEHKLADDLEQKTKNGYLERQDFLSRCDVRSFEQEKAGRNLLRNKQAAATEKK